MKIKKGYSLKTISGRHTIVADKTRFKNFNSVIILNETAVYLWNLLKEDINAEEMTKKLMCELNLSQLIAMSTVEIFIKTLKDNEIIDI